VSLVGKRGYFEDFCAGQRFRHWRGKTITDLETQSFTTLVMNTGNGHFNSDMMRDSEFGSPVAFGGVVASIVYGIVSQDTAEHVITEEGFDSIRFHSPARSGDTLYAVTEVLAAELGSDRESGRVRFRHTGFNQRGETVCELERQVLLHCREAA
jgi:acyl dehydratase